MPAVKAKFGADEKVLCFHGPLLYEAKVLKDARIEKSGPNANQPHYFVHYQGWRKSWDEWVPETRVLKLNEENLKKQKQLKSAASGPKEKKRKLETKEGDTPKSDKKRKSRHQTVEHVQVDDEFKSKPEVKIPVPDDLKRQLVDDWDFITRQKKLVGLPRKPSVQDIITQYLKDSNFKGHHLELAKEVTAGLITYFEHCLGSILLYRFERAQYVDIFARAQEEPEAATEGSNADGDQDKEKEHGAKEETQSLAGKKMSEIYGAEHLLRLFVKLPILLAHTDLEEDNCKVLVDSFQDILKYMSRNAPDLFLQDYENASAGHIRNST